MPAAGWPALPWTASTWQKHCHFESVEQQKTTGGGKSLPWTWCKARNPLRVVGLCWRTWGLNTHLICSPFYQPKACEVATLTEWFYTSAKEQMGPTNIPHVTDTGIEILSLSGQFCLPPPATVQLQGYSHCTVHTLAHTTADCHTVLIGFLSRTGIRVENSCRSPEIK